MRAFLAALAAIVITSVTAPLAFEYIGWSSAERQAGENVRLGK